MWKWSLKENGGMRTGKLSDELEDLPPNACFITKSMVPLVLTVDLQIKEK